MLDLVNGKTYAGNTAEQFVEAKPFKFLESIKTPFFRLYLH